MFYQPLAKKYFDEIVPKLNIIQMLHRKSKKKRGSSKKASFKDQNHPGTTYIKDIMKSKIYPLLVSSMFE